jgi:hypothetical protein
MYGLTQVDVPAPNIELVVLPVEEEVFNKLGSHFPLHPLGPVSKNQHGILTVCRSPGI